MLPPKRRCHSVPRRVFCFLRGVFWCSKIRAFFGVICGFVASEIGAPGLGWPRLQRRVGDECEHRPRHDDSPLRVRAEVRERHRRDLGRPHQHRDGRTNTGTAAPTPGRLRGRARPPTRATAVTPRRARSCPNPPRQHAARSMQGALYSSRSSVSVPCTQQGPNDPNSKQNKTDFWS